nr:rod shape-determining protein MreD [Anaerolineae bacterium]
MSLQLGIPLIVLASILQGAVLSQLRVFGGQPDLVMVIVLAWAVLDRAQEGIVWAFFGGLLLDLFSGTPLGVSSLAMMPLAFAASFIESRMYRENFVIPVVLAIVGALLYHILYVLLMRFLVNIQIEWSVVWWYVTLPSVVFDIILFVPTLRILRYPYDWLHPRQVTV